MTAKRKEFFYGEVVAERGRDKKFLDPLFSIHPGKDYRGFTGLISTIPFAIALFLNSVEAEYTPLSKQVNA